VTRHADLFGATGDYIVTVEQEIDAIERFRDEARSAEPKPFTMVESA